MKSCVLMGPPGSGKSTMYIQTLPPDAYPILVVDADRKLKSMEVAHPFLADGRIICWELDEPLTEEKLAQRLRNLAENKKPSTPPKGWTKFCSFAEDLEKKLEAKEAKTIVVDSGTVVGAHAMRMITYNDPKGAATLSPRDWAYYLMIWQETVTEFLDFCRKNDKNFIITFHERVSEVPGENNKVIKSKGEGGVVNREYIGTMNMKIVPSIQGQFANEVGAYFEEFYALNVVMQDDKPKWVCRIMPDGRRDLRTSYTTTKDIVTEPDFRKIWK